MSNTFQDINDQPWRISITVGNVRRVKQTTSINILEVPKDETSENVFERLMTDTIFFGEVLFALLEPQAKRRDPPIELDEFLDAIGPEELACARQIFWDQMTAFFRLSGQQAMAHGLEEGIKAATEMQNSEQMIQHIDKELAAVAEKVSGNLSSKSPESAESIPAHSHSES